METLEIHTQYGNLHVYKKGNGERKVLLLHGGGCDSAMLSWKEVMEQFGEQYTVYAPDLLGYGKSDGYEGICGERFFEIHIACIKELIGQLKLESYVLIGLSMGGAIAYSLIGNKEKITEELVDEVWDACKGDKAGQSMLDFQRSSITAKGTIPYYGNKLAQLKIPVIFVNGEEDPLVPVQDVERAKGFVKDGKIYILKKCKHWSVKEQSQEFYRIVEREY